MISELRITENRRALVAILLLLALGATSCFSRPSRPVPRVLRAYLDALVDGNHRKAYDLTQLEQLEQTFGQGASLSFAHFRAFHSANRMTDYAVLRVTRLESRPIERARERGSAFFEADVSLRRGAARARETFTVTEDPAVVRVEPDRLFLQLPPGTRSIVVDGVPTRLRRARIFDGRRVYPVLLLRGDHDLRLGRVRARISTHPPRVLGGDAAVEREADQATIVRLG